MLLNRLPAASMAASGRHSRRQPAPVQPTRYRPSPWNGEQKRNEEEEEQPGLALLRGAVPLQYLDFADASLAEYCSSAPTAEAREQCMEVLRYYREKRAAAQSGCILDLEQQQQQQQGQGAQSSSSPSSPSSSPACASLAALEKMLYETSYSADPASFYRVLRAQRAIDARLANNNNSSTASASPAADAARNTAAAADALRARALRLFHLADSDGDGRLDREEFLNSMRLMDAELTDAELGEVFSALDASCSLSAAQFVDAVTGEALLAAALGAATVDSDSELEEGEKDAQSASNRRGSAFLKRHVRPASGGGGGGGEAAAHATGPAALAGTGGADADVLRRVRHSRPTWWSDAPGYLEMI